MFRQYESEFACKFTFILSKKSKIHSDSNIQTPAKRQAGANRQVQVHPNVLVGAQIILEKSGNREKTVGRAWHISDIAAFPVADFAGFMLNAIELSRVRSSEKLTQLSAPGTNSPLSRTSIPVA